MRYQGIPTWDLATRQARDAARAAEAEGSSTVPAKRPVGGGRVPQTNNTDSALPASLVRRCGEPSLEHL